MNLAIGGDVGVAKVLLVSHWDWVLYNFRLPLARALRDAGLEVVLVCPSGDYVARLREAGFRWIEWNLNRKSMNPVMECRAICRLTRIYRSELPAAVHHFTIKPNVYGSLAARKARVPAIINTFSGLGYMLSGEAASTSLKVKAIRLLLRPVMWWALRAHNIWTIVENDEDARILMGLGFASGERTRVVPGSGVDVQRFTGRLDGCAGGGLSRASGPVRVIMAARLLKDKGVKEFVEAARLLRAQGHLARFLVAGAVDEGNPAAIDRATLEAWKSEGLVEFLGHRSDMPEVLSQCDIAVLPSYHEGLPKFLLEAAASGLPLVGTDIPGCRRIVRAGVNGVLVPPRDSQALAKAIALLLRDENLRRRYGQASRRIAVEEFAQERVLEQYLAVYRDAGVLRPSGQGEGMG